MGKNYKLPLPCPTPEIREKDAKKLQKFVFGIILPLFWAIFPIFGGRAGEGNLVIFPQFLGISTPEGFQAL